MKRLVPLLALAASVLAAPTAMAQSNLGLKGLGVAVGFVSPENADGTVSVGGLADWGTIAPRIGLDSRLDFWSETQNYADGSKATVSDIILGMRGKYEFETANPKVKPFAGAGLGLHFLHGKVTIPAQFGFPETVVESSDTKLGLDLGGGLATPVGPRTDLSGELWYGIVSDISQLSLRVAMTYRIGS